MVGYEGHSQLQATVPIVVCGARLLHDLGHMCSSLYFSHEHHENEVWLASFSLSLLAEALWSNIFHIYFKFLSNSHVTFFFSSNQCPAGEK